MLLTVLVVLGVGAVGAAGYGFVWYDRETRPDRSSPSASAGNYIGALLQDRDQNRADLFACDDEGGLSEIRRFQADIEEREKQLGTGIVVNVEDLVTEQQSGQEAVVTVTVRRSAHAGGVLQSLTDRWRLRMEDRDGWRVCQATLVT